MLCNSGEDPEREAEYLNLLPQKGIDGLILVPLVRTKKALYEHIPADLPLVVLDRPIPGIAATVSSDEEQLAGLLCACGCGHRITLLVPDSHRVVDDGGYATIRPSIGVFDAACRSHYLITAGEVDMLRAFNSDQADRIMRSQIARHVARDAKPAWWWQKAEVALRRFLENLRAIVRRRR